MKLRYAGLESLLFEDLCKVGMEERSHVGGVSAMRDDCSIFSGTNCTISEELQRMEVSSPFSTQNTPPDTAKHAGNSSCPPLPAQQPQMTTVEKVKAFM